MCDLLLKGGHEVFGVDAYTPYYDVALKQNRHAKLIEILMGFIARNCS